MAVKKTIKRTVKKRRRARKVVPMESVVALLEANSSVSAVNRRALTRLNKTTVAVQKAEKLVASAQDRVSKAVTAASAVKTAAAKEKAKLKVAASKAGLKEAKASLTAVNSERSKAERLVRGLHKSLVAAQTKMAKQFDKVAKAAEIAIDKKSRRRRRTRKKTVSPE
jgi:hypothetical protein